MKIEGFFGNFSGRFNVKLQESVICVNGSQYDVNRRAAFKLKANETCQKGGKKKKRRSEVEKNESYRKN